MVHPVAGYQLRPAFEMALLGWRRAVGLLKAIVGWNDAFGGLFGSVAVQTIAAWAGSSNACASMYPNTSVI